MYRNTMFTIVTVALILAGVQCGSNTYYECQQASNYCSGYGDGCQKSQELACVVLKSGNKYLYLQANSCCEACKAEGAFEFAMGECERLDGHLSDYQNQNNMNDHGDKDQYMGDMGDMGHMGDHQGGNNEEGSINGITEYGKCQRNDSSYPSKETHEMEGSHNMNKAGEDGMDHNGMDSNENQQDNMDEMNGHDSSYNPTPGSSGSSQVAGPQSYCGIVMDQSNKSVVDVIVGTSIDSICSNSNVQAYYYGNCDPQSALEVASDVLKFSLEGDLKLKFITLAALLLLGLLF